MQFPLEAEVRTFSELLARPSSRDAAPDAAPDTDGGAQTPAVPRGAWVDSGSSICAEITAASGLDFVIIDAEHSPITLETALSLLQAMSGYPTCPLVRIPAADPVLIKQYLDAGARNLIVPMVESADQACAVASAFRYPPHGIRGVGSALARASLWNLRGDYLANADALVNCVAQIESVTALENLEDIVRVDGIDAFFVGPADLGASMGLLGQQGHPEVVDAVCQTIAVAHRAGAKIGVNAFDPKLARHYVERGADFVCVTADVTLVAQGMRAAAHG